MLYDQGHIKFTDRLGKEIFMSCHNVSQSETSNTWYRLLVNTWKNFLLYSQRLTQYWPEFKDNGKEVFFSNHRILFDRQGFFLPNLS